MTTGVVWSRSRSLPAWIRVFPGVPPHPTGRPADVLSRPGMWLPRGQRSRARADRARSWGSLAPMGRAASGGYTSIPSPGEKAAWRSAAWALPYVAL